MLPIPKLLFKYRTLSSLEFFLDIVVRKRLHTSTYKDLNDPMEGAFRYPEDEYLKPFIADLLVQRERFRICALSETYNNTLMWAYYGEAHTGAAIGVEIDTDAPDVTLERVEYTETLVFEPFAGSEVDPETIKILSKKLPAWKHEKEVRVFSVNEFVPVAIKSIYFGYQINERRVALITDLMKIIGPAVTIETLRREDLDSQLYLA
jgi:hypothetical protein